MSITIERQEFTLIKITCEKCHRERSGHVPGHGITIEGAIVIACTSWNWEGVSKMKFLCPKCQDEPEQISIFDYAEMKSKAL